MKITVNNKPVSEEEIQKNKLLAEAREEYGLVTNDDLILKVVELQKRIEALEK